MYKSRVTIAIVLLLTVAATMDVYANRSAVFAVFDDWQEGFTHPAEGQGQAEHAGSEGEIRHEAAGFSKIVVRTNWGSVEVTGAETAEVTAAYAFDVRARTKDEAAEYLENLGLTIAPEGDSTLVVDFAEPVIRPARISDVRAMLEITVPKGVSVAVEGWSSVDLSGIDGDADVASNGPTRIADVGGNVRVSTRHIIAGDWETRPGGFSVVRLEVTSVGGDVELTSTYFQVRVNGVGGRLTAEVAGSDCEIAGVKGPVQLEAQSADVSVTDPGGDVAAECDNGWLSILGLRGGLAVRGRYSRVRVTPAPGTGFNIDASLEVAALASDYPLQSSQDGPMTTVSGRIGDGANPLTVSLVGGVLEIRKP
jgi:hypothetical protein